MLLFAIESWIHFLKSHTVYCKNNCLKENVKIYFSKHEMTKWISRFCVVATMFWLLGSYRVGTQLGKDWKSDD